MDSDMKNDLKPVLISEDEINDLIFHDDNFYMGSVEKNSELYFADLSMFRIKIFREMNYYFDENGKCLGIVEKNSVGKNKTVKQNVNGQVREYRIRTGHAINSERLKALGKKEALSSEEERNALNLHILKLEEQLKSASDILDRLLLKTSIKKLHRRVRVRDTQGREEATRQLEEQVLEPIKNTSEAEKLSITSKQDRLPEKSPIVGKRGLEQISGAETKRQALQNIHLGEQIEQLNTVIENLTNGIIIKSNNILFLRDQARYLFKTAHTFHLQSNELAASLQLYSKVIVNLDEEIQLLTIQFEINPNSTELLQRINELNINKRYQIDLFNQKNRDMLSLKQKIAQIMKQADAAKFEMQSFQGEVEKNQDQIEYLREQKRHLEDNFLLMNSETMTFPDEMTSNVYSPLQNFGNNVLSLDSQTSSIHNSGFGLFDYTIPAAQTPEQSNYLTTSSQPNSAANVQDSSLPKGFDSKMPRSGKS